MQRTPLAAALLALAIAAATLVGSASAAQAADDGFPANRGWGTSANRGFEAPAAAPLAPAPRSTAR